MKKIFPLAFLLILYSGCSDKEEGTSQKTTDGKDLLAVDTSDVKTSEAENPDEEFFLRYRFEKGKDYLYRVASISERKALIETDTSISQIMKEDIVYLIRLDLVSTDRDSTSELNCTFASLKYNGQFEDQKTSYQSGVTKDSADIARFADQEALFNNTFTARINKFGEIIDIYKLDGIVNRFMEIKNADSASAEERNLLKNDLIELSIRPVLQMIFKQVVPEKLAKDSLWQYHPPASEYPPFRMENTVTYKVASLGELKDDQIAVIDADTKTRVTGDKKVNRRGISYEFREPAISSTGKIYFNLTNGYIQKSKVTDRINFHYTMEVSTPAGKQKGTRDETTEINKIVELL